MALATLSIDIVAKLASLEEGMNKAGRLAEKEAARISAAFASVNNTITAIGGALGGAFAVAGIGEFIKSNAQAIDALNDLKDATGASIENLSGLEQVALKNGGTLEQVSGILVKFNGALKDADGKNGVSRILKDMGLDLAALKAQDPAEALQQVAIAMQRIEGDGDRARATQELFGKSVREAAPFLKDLAESGQLNGKVTTEQAEAAEKFNKQLAALATNSANMARALVSDLIPAMSRFLELAQRMSLAGGYFSSIGQELKANLASDQLRVVVADIEGLQKTIDRQGADAALTKRMAGLRAEAARLSKEAQAASDSLKAFSQVVAPLEASYSNEGKNYKLPGIKLTGAAGKEPSKPKEDNSAEREFQALLERITKRGALIQKELELGRKLTEGEQLEIEINEKLASSKSKLNATEENAIRLALTAAANDAARLEQQTQLIETTKAIDKVLAEVDAKRFAKLNDANEKQSERNAQLLNELATLGKTREEVEALSIAREAEALALKESELALLSKSGLNEGEIEAMQRQVQLLRESVAIRREILGKTTADAQDPLAGASQAIKDYLKEVENAGEGTRKAVGNAMQSLEGALTDALTGKQVDARALVDQIIQEFLRLAVIKPLLANIFGGGPGGPGGTALGSIFSALFSGSPKMFAQGGYLGAGEWGIAGEAGPEVIQGPATITPFAKLPTAQGGGGITINQYNTIGDGVNYNQVVAAMATSRRQAVNDVIEYQRRGRMQ